MSNQNKFVRLSSLAELRQPVKMPEAKLPPPTIRRPSQMKKQEEE